MSMAQYTARKSLEAIAANMDDREKGLTKSLGPFSLIGLGIGCIIGAGIFVLTGKAAANYAGPATRFRSSCPASPAPSLAFATLNWRR